MECKSEVSELIYKFIRLEILFLLTYHTRAKAIAVVGSGTRNDSRSSCLYDTLNKLSPWHTFSNMAKIRSPWLTFSNMAKIRYYFLQTIIVDRNRNKTTKVAFLSEVQNLFAWKFFASCVMVVSLFQCFLNVSHCGKRVCHCGSWFATMTQKLFSHFTLVLESELNSVLETCIRAAWLLGLSIFKKISQDW